MAYGEAQNDSIDWDVDYILQPFLVLFPPALTEVHFPHRKILEQKIISTHKGDQKHCLCVFLFIDLKIFASPGESGSTQETCLPTPSSKR